MATDFLTQALTITATYVALLFMFFFIMNFLTNGFIGKYLQVKASRGAKILVDSATTVDNYFAVGKVVDDCLHYKARSKDKKIMSNVPKRAIKRIMGINVIYVDETTGCFIMHDGKPPETCDVPDANICDRLVERALMAGSKKDILITVLLVLVILLIISNMIQHGQIYNIGQQVESFQNLTGVV